MRTSISQKLFLSIKNAQKKISKLNPKQKSALERAWDIEHAYYSSTLEGSKLDRKDFEKLAEKIA